MNNLQIFHDARFGNVRTVKIDGEPWLVAVDVCNALGYQNARDAVSKHVEEEDKRVLQKSQIATLEIPNRGMMVINESGFYQLCFGSKLPSARDFRRWVTNDVLKSIRRQGFYLDTTRGDVDPDVVINLCHQIKAQRKKLELALEDNHILEQQVKELAPKATYYDLILNSKGLVSVTEIAKDYGQTAIWLNQKLHELGVQFQLPGQRTWILKRDFDDKGYTQSKTHDYLDKDGGVKSKMHTYWTQAGRIFIYNLLKQNGILPIIERTELVDQAESTDVVAI